MKKLSKIQQEVLGRMEPGKYYCSYHLQCKISTLWALSRKGYLISHTDNSLPGGSFCPTTHYHWKKK